MKTKRILKNKNYRTEFNWLGSKLAEMSPSRRNLDEILNAIDDNNRNENGKLTAFTAQHLDSVNCNEQIVADARVHCFTFANAWETPMASDLNSLKTLKSLLHADVDRDNHEHTLKYFDVIVKDYPGEYFLQSPYIFAVRNLFFHSFIHSARMTKTLFNRFVFI